VIYDAEHFFDGYKDNASFALETVMAAAQSGADAIILCDTNGGTLPFDIEEVVEAVRHAFAEQGRPVKLGIHAHNDCGLAVANSIAAVKGGRHHRSRHHQRLWRALRQRRPDHHHTDLEPENGTDQHPR
jgi:2-isopropylmalate synthase